MEVHIRVDDRLKKKVGAVVTENERFDLTINCSVPEKERIVRQLNEDRFKVDLLVFDEAPEGGRGFGPGITRYGYKFDVDRLQPRETPEPVGRVSMVGPGAGGPPTSSAILSDVLLTAATLSGLILAINALSSSN